MGNIVTTPGTPPIALDTLPEQWNWISENESWGVVHFLVVLSLYFGTRSFLWTIFLVYLSESFESLLQAVRPETTWNETKQDMLLSDPIIAVLAMAFGELVFRVFDHKSRLTTKSPRAFFKSIFQSIVLNAPLVATARFYFGQDANFILFCTYGWAWYLLCLYVFYKWNKHDSKMQLKGDKHIYIAWWFTAFSFFVLHFYKFTHVFLMTYIWGVLLCLWLGLYLLFY